LSIEYVDESQKLAIVNFIERHGFLDSKLFDALDNHVHFLNAMHKSVPVTDGKWSLNCDKNSS
jgi:hypothetical protein